MTSTFGSQQGSQEESKVPWDDSQDELFAELYAQAFAEVQGKTNGDKMVLAQVQLARGRPVTPSASAIDMTGDSDEEVDEMICEQAQARAEQWGEVAGASHHSVRPHQFLKTRQGSKARGVREAGSQIAAAISTMAAAQKDESVAVEVANLRETAAKYTQMIVDARSPEIVAMVKERLARLDKELEDACARQKELRDAVTAAPRPLDSPNRLQHGGSVLPALPGIQAVKVWVLPIGPMGPPQRQQLMQRLQGGARTQARRLQVTAISA
ncbi:hypothetical protein QJQ45_023597 [Haematococcus lacustris]|nr:hypothetical protein QJQ45_023597 [Haematococcus lacustris]